MASSLALDERALILAPPPLAAQTSHLLSAAGIDCLCATDLGHLHARLAEGAGLAIIAEQVFNAGPAPCCRPLSTSNRTGRICPSCW